MDIKLHNNDSSNHDNEGYWTNNYGNNSSNDNNIQNRYDKDEMITIIMIIINVSVKRQVVKIMMEQKR